MTCFLQQGPASRCFLHLPAVPPNGDKDSNLWASLRYSRSKLWYSLLWEPRNGPTEETAWGQVRASLFCSYLCTLPCVQQLAALWTLSYWGFVPLRWSLMTSSSFSFTGLQSSVWEGGKVPTLSLSGWCPQTRLPLEGIQESPPSKIHFFLLWLHTSSMHFL